MTTYQQIGDRTLLHDGVHMPWLGLGVWQTKGDEVVQSVTNAIETGYRLIDTAAAYKNEEGVGQALRDSSIPRDLLFVTTKIWNGDQGYDSTLQAFEESRKKLGLEVVDLLLIHWPVKGKYKDTWKALVELKKQGHVRSIGVSNFQPHHLQDIIDDSGVVPTVNQVEFHPLLQQTELRAFCRQHNIQLQAWSPLMQGNLDLPLLAEIAEKHGKTPAQVVLRWDLQHGIATIPKSVKKHRIEENASIFDFELSDEDMTRIDGLNQNKRFGPDPDNFNF